MAFTAIAFASPLRLDLRAVLHRRDAVQLVESLEEAAVVRKAVFGAGGKDALAVGDVLEIGRASCRERV